jgi:hypothetical protein
MDDPGSPISDESGHVFMVLGELEIRGYRF